MSRQYFDIKLVCGHGITDGETTFVDRFVFAAELGDGRWIPQALGHQRMSQLKGNTLLTFPLAQEPTDDDATRDRYSAQCARCHRTVVRRDEKLQELLNAAHAHGLDTLRIENLR